MNKDHAGAAEQADLAALGVRREEVNDLDAGHENFGFGGLLGEDPGAGSVNGAAGLGDDLGCSSIDSPLCS